MVFKDEALKKRRGKIVVTCTDQPGVLRVAYTAFEDDDIKREAVCYLQPLPTGQIEILYSHHSDFHRPTKTGAWENVQDFKIPLTASLRSEIYGHVLHEFGNAFGFKIRELTRKVAQVPVPESELSGGVKFSRLFHKL